MLWFRQLKADISLQQPGFNLSIYGGTKRYWDRFLFKYFSFLLSLSFDRCCILSSYSSHRCNFILATDTTVKWHAKMIHCVRQTATFIFKLKVSNSNHALHIQHCDGTVSHTALIVVIYFRNFFQKYRPFKDLLYWHVYSFHLGGKLSL
jgi:hypothetical protein